MAPKKRKLARKDEITDGAPSAKRAKGEGKNKGGPCPLHVKDESLWPETAHTLLKRCKGLGMGTPPNKDFLCNLLTVYEELYEHGDEDQRDVPFPQRRSNLQRRGKEVQQFRIDLEESQQRMQHLEEYAKAQDQHSHCEKERRRIEELEAELESLRHQLEVQDGNKDAKTATSCCKAEKLQIAELEEKLAKAITAIQTTSEIMDSRLRQAQEDSKIQRNRLQEKVQELEAQIQRKQEQNQDNKQVRSSQQESIPLKKESACEEQQRAIQNLRAENERFRRAFVKKALDTLQARFKPGITDTKGNDTVGRAAILEDRYEWIRLQLEPQLSTLDFGLSDNAGVIDQQRRMYYLSTLARTKGPKLSGKESQAKVTMLSTNRRGKAMEDAMYHYTDDLTIDIGGQKTVFKHFQVYGDGMCLWRAFARAYWGNEHYWETAQDCAREQFLNVIDYHDKVVSKRRYELYFRLAKDDKMLAVRLRLDKKKKPTSGHDYRTSRTDKTVFPDIKRYQVRNEDCWGDVNCLQYLADWFGLRIFVQQPVYEIEEGGQWPNHIPNWNAFQVRGNPDAPQIHLIYYQNLYHWAALAPPPGWKHPGKLNLSDEEWRRRSQPYERYPPDHPIYPNQLIDPPLPLDRTKHRPHGSDDVKERSKTLTQHDYPGQYVIYDEESKERNRKLHQNQLERNLKETGQRADDVLYSEAYLHFHLKAEATAEQDQGTGETEKTHEDQEVSASEETRRDEKTCEAE